MPTKNKTSGGGPVQTAGKRTGKAPSETGRQPKKTAPARDGRRSRGRGGFPAGLLIVALLGVAAVMYAVLRMVNGGPLLAEAPTPSPAPTPRPTATAAPTPVPTPEPTPYRPAVDVNSWELRLVRYEYPLGEDYAPPELADVGDGQQMDSRVAPALLQLVEDAKAAGNPVWVCSGYRDYDTQYSIYWNHIYEYTSEGMTEEEAHAKTRLAVNYPGSSEHQSGLSVDVLEYNGQPMEPYIGGSGLMLWLEQHCAEYGFVIRYPDGKTDITGVEYEPWHLRYVGKTAAQFMMENGLCLEEFLQLYQSPAEAEQE